MILISVRVPFFLKLSCSMLPVRLMLHCTSVFTCDYCIKFRKMQEVFFSGMVMMLQIIQWCRMTWGQGAASICFHLPCCCVNDTCDFKI